MPQQDRDHVAATEGLAQGRHPLRPMPKGRPLSYRTRRDRHVLAMTQVRVRTLAAVPLSQTRVLGQRFCRTVAGRSGAGDVLG